MMTGPEILKVSVLATNELLLDGQPVTLAELKQVIERCAKANAVIWYYREEAASGPPSIAVEAFKVITNNRLPVRLSSRPDFSDTVTSAIEFASVEYQAKPG